MLPPRPGWRARRARLPWCTPPAAGAGGRLVGAVLRGVQQDVPDPGGAAAAAIVVPESWAQALRDTGGHDRVQAPMAQPRDLQTGHAVHAGVSQCGEQVRGSGWPVAPGVGHRLHVTAGVRQGVRDDEPAVFERAHGEQVLGALPRRRDEVITVQGCSGDRQRRGYPGGAVRVVRHPGRPARMHGPPAHQGCGQRPAGGPRHRSSRCRGHAHHRPRPRPAPPRSPQDQVVHWRGRSSPQLRGCVPSGGGHQGGEPRQRHLLAAGKEQFQRCHVPGQPGIERRVGPNGRRGGEPGRDPGRQGLLSAGHRPGQADLGQYRGQATDPRIHRVAILTRCGGRPSLRHHLGQPGAIVLPDLTQNP